jgi:hypothetical protein
MSDETLAQPGSQAARDFFAWEMLMRKQGLFAPAMFGDEPLDDDGIREGLQKGEIYLATVDQQRAFSLHGGSHTGTPPEVDDADDLGFAPLGRIGSLELGADGKPLRAGRSFSFREDWVWAVPAHDSQVDASTAYELVKFLWQKENHVRACEALGQLPLRLDVQRERSSLFRLIWMDDVYDAAFAELPGAQPVPDSVEGGLGATYAELWKAIVAEGGSLKLLQSPPSPSPEPEKVAEKAEPKEPPEATLKEEDDDDRAEAIDTELWRGKVELDR